MLVTNDPPPISMNFCITTVIHRGKCNKTGWRKIDSKIQPSLFNFPFMVSTIIFGPIIQELYSEETGDIHHQQNNWALTPYKRATSDDIVRALFKVVSLEMSATHYSILIMLLLPLFFPAWLTTSQVSFYGLFLANVHVVEVGSWTASGTRDNDWLYVHTSPLPCSCS